MDDVTAHRYVFNKKSKAYATLHFYYEHFLIIVGLFINECLLLCANVLKLQFCSLKAELESIFGKDVLDIVSPTLTLIIRLIRIIFTTSPNIDQ